MAYKGITVDEHAVLGAGSLLLRDLSDRMIAHGLPAKDIRTRAIGERYQWTGTGKALRPGAGSPSRS